MSISQKELGEAFIALQDRFAESVEDSSWESVQVLQGPDAKILRIVRKIESSSDDFISSESHEEIITEDDDEVMHPAVRGSQHVRVIYDIVHSPSYQVPVLYVTFQHNTGPGAPPPLDQVYEMLTPPFLRDQLQPVGVMGALSMTDHPVTGLPAFFIHPCQTASAMKDVTGHDEVAPERYLLLWMGLIGQSVGLDVPTRLAEAASNVV